MLSCASQRIIYRVEMQNGLGPYSNNLPLATDYKRQPTIHDDGGFSMYDRTRVWDERMHFAFDSLASLQRWFDDEQLDVIAHYGGRIVCYHAEKAIAGHAQVAFDKQSARCIGHFPASVLLS